MSILDQLFRDKDFYQKSLIRSTASGMPTTQSKGKVSAKRVFIDGNSAWKMKQHFVAFDVETTGLSPQFDRIIALGAVLFENRRPTARFSTLVNPGMPVPASATRVNHITNQMLENAPDEFTAFADLSSFLAEVLRGKTFLCAHNADFDTAFLMKALSRLGYDADIRYVDTLVLSRVYIRDVPDHRLSTVAGYFSIDTGSSHRAGDDAEVCGHIMCRLIDLLQ